MKFEEKLKHLSA